MRLNGALRPHGAPYIGRSIGAKNYRDKRPQQQQQQQKSIYKYNNQHNNNTTTASDQSNNNNITTLPAVAAAAAVNNFKRTPGYYPSTNEPDVFINKQHNTSHKRSGTSVKMAPINSRSRKIAAAGRAGCDGGRVSQSADMGVKHERHLMRVPQSLAAGLSSYSTFVLCLVYVLALLPTHVICDDDNGFFVNTFSMGPETTTPEFDYASRGKKKFGDKCENTLECGFPGSICDPKKKSCQCVEELPVTNHIDKCGKGASFAYIQFVEDFCLNYHIITNGVQDACPKQSPKNRFLEAAVNESCFFNEQCESINFPTECRDGRCVCRFEMTAILGKDGIYECKPGNKAKGGPETYIDPAMIGVLVGMALMFVIICVVLRLFSQARWRENRTIFNTPNPRLMNVSLLRDSKLLHGQERRGSRMSVRAPSRQPSMASLRPHSPNPSLGKTGSRSGSGSNASATSVRSTRSNSVAPGAVNHDRKSSAPHHHHQHQQQPQQQPLITNITSNPVAENVTVEIIEPEK